MLLNRGSVRTLDDGVAESDVRDVFTRDRDNFTVYAGNRHLSGLGQVWQGRSGQTAGDGGHYLEDGVE